VAQLRELAGLITQTKPVRELPSPPDRIWHGIIDELAMSPSQPRPADPVDTLRQLRREKSRFDRPAPRPGAVRKRARRWASGIAAAAAANLDVLGVRLAVEADSAPPPVVVSSAELAAYGDTQASATGAAQLISGPTLRLQVANLPAVDGYYEVWLIDPDTLGMFSVGVLGSGQTGQWSLVATATPPLPASPS
jgi:anti-sigma-K factor RskA